MGGLSVAREIRQSLPGEDVLYIADTAYCPYGDRSLEEVRRRVGVMATAGTLASARYAKLVRVLGPDVRLVDSAPAIARRTEHLLRDAAAASRNGPGAFRVLTTGDPRKVAPVVARLWGTDVPVAAVQI